MSFVIRPLPVLKYKHAVAACDIYLAQVPPSARIRFLRGTFHHEKGEHTLGRQDYESAIHHPFSRHDLQLNSSLARYCLFSGLLALDMGDSRGAVNDLREAVKYDAGIQEDIDDLVVLYAADGAENATQGQETLAIAAFLRSLLLMDNFAVRFDKEFSTHTCKKVCDLLDRRASRRQANGEVERAIDDYELMLDLLHRHPDVPRDQTLWDRILPVWQKCEGRRKSSPRTESPEPAKASLLQFFKYQHAVTACSEEIEAALDRLAEGERYCPYDLLYFIRGILRHEEGHLDLAREDYESAWRIAPATARYNLFLGLLHLERLEGGNADLALRFFRLALDEDETVHQDLETVCFFYHRRMLADKGEAGVEACKRFAPLQEKLSSFEWMQQDLHAKIRRSLRRE